MILESLGALRAISLSFRRSDRHEIDDDSTAVTNDRTDRLTLSGDKADDKAVWLPEVHRKTE